MTMRVPPLPTTDKQDRQTRLAEQLRANLRRRKVQARALETLPCIPLGQLFQPTAFRSDIRDIVKAAFPLFWGVRRA